MLCLAYNKPLINVVLLLNAKPQRTCNLFREDLPRANKPWGDDEQGAGTDPGASILSVISCHPEEGTLTTLPFQRAEQREVGNPLPVATQRPIWLSEEE